jgi:hypothetical protein
MSSQEIAVKMRMFVCAWLPFQAALLFLSSCSLYPQAEAAIAQRRAKGVMIQYFFPSNTFLVYTLLIWQYLGLDALTSSHHVERSRKILQRKCGCQHRFCINHATTDKVEGWLK